MKKLQSHSSRNMQKYSSTMSKKRRVHDTKRYTSDDRQSGTQFSHAVLQDDKKTFPVININYNNRKPIKRPGWDEYFLNVAEAISKRSCDGETQVGVVIVDENKRILATGYNGFPPGCKDDQLPNLRPDKYPFVVHAEMNAIASSRQDLRNATLYCTYSPCRDCAKAIITAGIKHVVFKQAYKNDDYEFMLEFLSSCNIKVRQQDY